MAKKTPTKKAAATGRKAPKQRKATTGGSKTEKIVALLKRADGATAAELQEATGWQAHSVRGFISGVLGKKLGLSVTSTKNDNGERVYSIAA